jgi:hypothetical protein
MQLTSASPGSEASVSSESMSRVGVGWSPAPADTAEEKREAALGTIWPNPHYGFLQGTNHESDTVDNCGLCGRLGAICPSGTVAFDSVYGRHEKCGRGPAVFSPPWTGCQTYL